MASFLKDLKRFGGDALAFAVPAGISLAATKFLGPAGPMTSRAIMSALAAGAGGVSRKKEEDRAQKYLQRQRSGQSMAQYINALAPQIRYQAPTPEMPKAGLIEQIGKGTSKGFQLFEAAEKANLAREYLQGQVQEQAAKRAQDEAAAIAAGGVISDTPGLKLEVERATVGPGRRAYYRTRPPAMRGLFRDEVSSVGAYDRAAAAEPLTLGPGPDMRLDEDTWAKPVTTQPTFDELPDQFKQFALEDRPLLGPAVVDKMVETKTKELGLLTAQEALEDARLKNALARETFGSNVNIAQANADKAHLLNEELNQTITGQQPVTQDSLNTRIATFANLSPHISTPEEFFNHPEVRGLLLLDTKQGDAWMGNNAEAAWQLYQAGAQKRLTDLRTQLGETQHRTIKLIHETNPDLKDISTVATQYAKVKGLVADLLSDDPKTRGAGQTTLINVFNRGFVDVGMAVRKEDIDNIRAAQSFMQQVALFFSNKQEGDIFSPDLVAKIDQTVEELYGIVHRITPETLDLAIAEIPMTPEERESVKNMIMAPLTAVPLQGAIQWRGSNGNGTPIGSAALGDSSAANNIAASIAVLDSPSTDSAQFQGPLQQVSASDIAALQKQNPGMSEEEARRAYQNLLGWSWP